MKNLGPVSNRISWPAENSASLYFTLRFLSCSRIASNSLMITIEINCFTLRDLGLFFFILVMPRNRNTAPQLTYYSLAEEVAKRLNLPIKGGTLPLVREVLDVLTESIASRKCVELRGLGRFSYVKWKARKGRMPDGSDGSEVIIPPHWRVVFQPSKKLKRRVMSGSVRQNP